MSDVRVGVFVVILCVIILVQDGLRERGFGRWVNWILALLLAASTAAQLGAP